MKLRLTLLVLALALLIAPVAVFAAPPEASAPAVCPAQASILDSVTLKILPRSLTLAKCGTCSDTICRGANLGSICGIGGGGQYKLCGDVGICSNNLTQCLCKTGPPL